MDIEFQLRQALNSDKLSKLEYKIAMDVIANFDLIVENTATSLAELYFTNTTTIYRFSKKIGFESYSEFRSAVKLTLNEKLKNDYAHSLATYIENIDFEGIYEKVKIFNREERYILFGLGASNISAQAFQRQMLMLGYNVMICDWDNVHFCIDNNNLVIVSSSGETHEAIMLINQVKDRAKRVISITKEGSTLFDLSDISFTHNVIVSKDNPLLHEQQTHMHIVISEIIKELYKLYSHTF